MRQLGIVGGMAQREYLAVDAIGSRRLEWLNESPMTYRYMVDNPPDESKPMELGTAVHRALFEPELFKKVYVEKPPRMTAKLRAAAAIAGQVPLSADDLRRARAMAASVRAHPKAREVMAAAPELEMSVFWERQGRLCRGRPDMVGKSVVADLKTTHDLRRFSPCLFSKFGYHRQAAWYEDGLRRHGLEFKHHFIVVVSSKPPHDVGVFAVDEFAMKCGFADCERLMRTLDECEASGAWPGMFPDVQVATVTDQEIAVGIEEVQVGEA